MVTREESSEEQVEMHEGIPPLPPVQRSSRTRLTFILGIVAAFSLGIVFSSLFSSAPSEIKVVTAVPVHSESVDLPKAVASSPSSCINSWKASKARYDARIDRFRQFRPSSEPREFPLDYIEPLWDCEAKDRVGTSPFGDGPKFMCNVDFTLKDPDCLVYSIGSNGDGSFEEAVLAISRQCEVHTFDCTLDMNDPRMQRFVADAPSKGIHFHDSCLAKPGSRIGNSKTVTLRDAMKYTANQRPISHFKIDCEGCEFSSFYDDLGEFDASDPPFDQLMIEIHTPGMGSIQNLFNLFDRLHNLGLLLFSKERNAWGCGGVHCAEFSFISERAAFRGHIHNQCPEHSGSWKQLCGQLGIRGCSKS